MKQLGDAGVCLANCSDNPLIIPGLLLLVLLNGESSEGTPGDLLLPLPSQPGVNQGLTELMETC